MAKAKKIYFRDMLQHDKTYGDCAVRQLEMAAESAITAPGYNLQFWQDVKLYGVLEAILYVRNGNYGNADAILETWNEIRVRIDNPVDMNEPLTTDCPNDAE